MSEKKNDEKLEEARSFIQQLLEDPEMDVEEVEKIARRLMDEEGVCPGERKCPDEERDLSDPAEKEIHRILKTAEQDAMHLVYGPMSDALRQLSRHRSEMDAARELFVDDTEE